jgi:3,4-dihydroxy 2-butanone 4-phosphate synthase / GTP cyclohydrolase II
VAKSLFEANRNSTYFTARLRLRYNFSTLTTAMEVQSTEKPAAETCCDSVETGTVERIAVASLPTEWGDFQIAAYRSLTHEEEFVALFKGEMRRDVPTLVRIHSQCLTGDVFGSTKCDCGRQLRRTMQMIQQEGRGAIVYQQQEGRGIGIVNKIRAYALQDLGADTVEANERLGLAVDLRDYRQCAEILYDLGLCQVKVISNNPLKLRALEEAGLTIVERVSIEVDPSEDALGYLRTKKEKLGHLLELKRT